MTDKQTDELIKKKLVDYLHRMGHLPDKAGRYHCIATDHKDGNPSMTIHKSGAYATCWSHPSPKDSFTIFDAIGVFEGIQSPRAQKKRAYEIYQDEIDELAAELASKAEAKISDEAKHPTHTSKPKETTSTASDAPKQEDKAAVKAPEHKYSRPVKPDIFAPKPKASPPPPPEAIIHKAEEKATVKTSDHKESPPSVTAAPKTVETPPPASVAPKTAETPPPASAAPKTVETPPPASTEPKAEQKVAAKTPDHTALPSPDSAASKADTGSTATTPESKEDKAPAAKTPAPQVLPKTGSQRTIDSRPPSVDFQEWKKRVSQIYNLKLDSKPETPPRPPQTVKETEVKQSPPKVEPVKASVESEKSPIIPVPVVTPRKIKPATDDSAKIPPAAVKKPEPEPKAEPAPEPEPKAKPVPEPEPKVKPVPEPEPKVKPAPEPEPKVKPASESQPKAEPAPEPEPKAKPVPEPEPKVKPAPEPEPKAKLASEPQPKAEPAPEPEPKVKPASEPEPKVKPASEPEPKAEPAPKPEPKAKPVPEPEPKAKPASEPEPEPKAAPVPVPQPKAEPAPAPVPEPAIDAYLIQNRMTSLLADLQTSDHAQNWSTTLSTGLSGLDELLGGGLRPGLYMICSRPGEGKTSFALQIADTIAAQGKDVLWISLDMAREELIAKSLSRLTLLLDNTINKKNACTAQAVLEGLRDISAKAVLQKALQTYQQTMSSFYCQEALSESSMNDIEHIISQYMAVTGSKPVVVIDCLQYIRFSDGLTETAGIDRAVRNLMQYSRARQIPLLALSASIHDTYNSDVIISLQMEPASGTLADPHVVELEILKNRYGAFNKKIPFNFFAAFNCLEEK
ncbi:MAG: DnaB-like helicase C-terminal domain-containing protein [Bacillota bacterium]|nr:DnaB-like helicase C-terminal domain-containing protein [Bacillota bacterium]